LDILSVSPALGLLSQFGSSAPALVPGQVIEAVVLALLEDGSVRLALPGGTLDVRSTVPLTAGSSVQLTVKSTAPGLQLVLSSQSSVRGSAAAAVSEGAGQTPTMIAASETETETVEGQGLAMAMATTAEDQAVNISFQEINPTTQAAMMERPATPQASASGVVSSAVRTAAARQGGLAPLMADVEQLVGGDAIEAPVAVLKAAAQLLALRLPLQSDLTAADIKQALSQSGLFLEARLAVPNNEGEGASCPIDRPGGGATPSSPSAASTSATSSLPSGANALSSAAELASPATDLKAALLMFRQVVQLWAAQASAEPNASPTASNDPANTSPLAAAASEPAEASLLVAGPSGPASASLLIAGASEPASASPLVAGASEPAPVNPTIAGMGEPAEASLLVVGASELALASPLVAAASEPDRSLFAAASEAAPEPGEPAGSPPADAPPPPPPPPYRGSPPVAQPATAATLASASSPADAAQRLLGATDAALARHTLLQAASLPDRLGADPARVQTQGPQWTFEVPVMTSAGTSIAQFEISRDGRAVTADGRAMWRARFSVDVEPMGPVHAQVTLSGNRTTVLLWAERPQSAARLRERSTLLADALRQAELEPGDIHCRAGAPTVPRASLPAAGRFLDRAS
jgi:Flagellar hook-length control protein FliK